MAAPPLPDIAVSVLDLRHVSDRDIRAVLDEEAIAWREILDWDFAPSAELVREFVAARSLSGFALRVGNDLAGYSYFVTEDHKGLIGDVFLRKAYRTWTWENMLIEATVRTLVSIHGLRRVESQLMLIDTGPGRSLPYADRIEEYKRLFMSRLASYGPINIGRAHDAAVYERWRDMRHEEAAIIIGRTYENHVDSRINDQYRTIAGARRFVHNIVQYPGCGRFCPDASFLAYRKDNGLPCGVILTSLVAPDVGHITQVCVTPESQHLGLGYELIRRAIERLYSLGCRKVSLSVTASNNHAISLYERMGFTTQRRFSAHVWDFSKS